MYYYLVVGISLGIMVILALSINIITGYAGQPTLGHAAFLGIGAYASALLTTTHGLSFWLALPLSALIAATIGFVVGLASLRVRADFLAITTMGINFVVVAVFLYSPYFGGALGIGNIPAPVILGSKLGKPGYLVLVIIAAALTALFCRLLERSWAGLALGAIRDDETAAEAMGIDVRKSKLLAFVLGTGLAGMAGSLYAHHITFISATDFGFPFSMTILTMAVFGGLGTISGAVAGALVLGLAPEVFRPIAEYRMLVYGALLVIMMMFQPAGLLGRGSYVSRLLGRRSRGKGVEIGGAS